MNLRPTDYESAALTAELRARTFKCNNLRGFTGAADGHFGGFLGDVDSRRGGRYRFGFGLLLFQRVQLLQPLEGALHVLRRRVNVLLRNRHAAVSSNPDDREGVGDSFPEASQHGVP